MIVEDETEKFSDSDHENMSQKSVKTQDHLASGGAIISDRQGQTNDTEMRMHYISPKAKATNDIQEMLSQTIDWDQDTL